MTTYRDSKNNSAASDNTSTTQDSAEKQVEEVKNNNENGFNSVCTGFHNRVLRNNTNLVTL